MSSGASFDPQLLAGMSHRQIAAALSDPTSPVAKAVDGSANVLTAALCEVTGQQPTAVCTAPGVAAAAKTLAQGDVVTGQARTSPADRTVAATSAPRWARLGSLILPLAGLAVSAYLTVEHYSSSTTLACPETGVVNCVKVTTSSYSTLVGVPVALLGLLFFAAMSVLCRRSPGARPARGWAERGWRAPLPGSSWSCTWSGPSCSASTPSACGAPSCTR